MGLAVLLVLILCNPCQHSIPTRAKDAAGNSKDKFFEIFAIEQVLRDFDMSDDEIENGIIGGGGDCGYDFGIKAGG